MDNLIEKIKEYVMEECRKYKEASEDHYDFWNEHIRYVYKEAVDLAKKYDADETASLLFGDAISISAAPIKVFAMAFSS